MKFTAFLLLVFSLQVSATGKAQTVTLSGKKIPLATVFAAIEKQTGYVVFIPMDVLSKSKPVNVDARNMPLEQLLHAVLDGQSMTYKIAQKTIAISEKAIKAAEQKQHPLDLVIGTVRMENGKPLAGASVRVKGTTNMTITDSKGQFSIPAGVGSVIVVSYVGFEEFSITLTNTEPVSITMRMESMAMDTAVVMVNNGYQALPKERSAGAYAKPELNIMKNRSASMNILQRLDGLIPGLTVNNSLTAGQNPYLIRGLTTIGIEVTAGGGAYGSTPRTPLYVVDGIPMDDVSGINVSSINPQDVADVTVLKDATAASIWGARAANGVIVITTKKGTRNSKMRVEYDGFVNFQGKPDIDYYPVLNSQQFIQAAKDVFDPVTYPWAAMTGYPATNGVPAPHEVILYNQYRGLITAEQANKSLDSLGAINNVGQIKDLWYRNALLTNHTISVAGGDRIYAYYGSASYTNTQSSRPGDKNSTYKLNLRQDFNLGSRVRLSLNTDLTNNVNSKKRNIEIDNRFFPYQLFKDENGNNVPITYMTTLSDSIRKDFATRSRINLDYDPLAEVDYGYTKGNSLLSRNILGVNVKLIDGLSFEGTYGYIFFNNKLENYDDLKSYAVRSQIVQFTVAPTTASTPVYYLPTGGGNFIVDNVNQRNWTVRNQLVYNRGWGKHQVTVLAGQEAWEQQSASTTSRVRGYNDLLQTYGQVDYVTLSTTGIAGTVMPTSGTRSVLQEGPYGQSTAQNRFTSYYGNLAYTYDRKYTLNGSVRIDKSNQFGIDKSAQQKPVWSVGGKWLASSESFMKQFNWLNSLALRATYGLTGNAPAPGTATSYDVLSSSASPFFQGGTGLGIATTANRKLSWESTATTNVGLDFAVLQSRIRGSVEVYSKKTTDMLGLIPINGFTGYSNIIGNIGNMTNKGIEISLTTVNVQTREFSWSTMFNIAYNKNKLTDFKAKSLITTTGNVRVKEQYVTGYSAYSVFAYEWAGLDNLGDPQIRLADGTVTKALNASKPEDIKYMGTSQPIWSGGIANMFTYGNFGLSANAVLNLDYLMRKDVNQFFTGGRFTHGSNPSQFERGNVHADFANRWRKPGDEAYTNIPSYEGIPATAGSRRDLYYYWLADINVVDASFIKFRDITLSYMLPSAVIRRMGANQVSFRAQVSNVMLWKANKDGIDPEFQFMNGQGGARIARSNQNTITLGANVKF